MRVSYVLFILKAIIGVLLEMGNHGDQAVPALNLDHKVTPLTLYWTQDEVQVNAI